MYIISYDIASKSLALSIIKFNDTWKNDLILINKSFQNYIMQNKSSENICKFAIKCINDIELLLNNIITPILFDVVDIIPNQKLKDTKPLLRSKRLKAYLYSIDQNYLNSLKKNNPNDLFKVLLEYQMGPNDKSRNVCSQILYHYSPMDTGFKQTTVVLNKYNTIIEKHKSSTYDIEIIGPSLKNKINLIRDKPLGFYMKKYAKKYDANKNHSKANLLQWVKQKKIEHMMEHIPKKNIDDIADSVNMTLAWLFVKAKLI
jgi:hypothetical protein